MSNTSTDVESFPRGDVVPKAPLQQTCRDDPGDMTGHERLDRPQDIETTGGSKKLRSDEGNTRVPQPSPEKQVSTHHFKENPDIVAGSPMTQLPISKNKVQQQLYRDADKAGLCVICSCTQPHVGEPIKNCTATLKMRTCFETKLGFSTILVEPNMSSQNLYSLLRELSTLQIPDSCGGDFRFLFYFFGHGFEDSICLADGNVKRSEIISELQKMKRTIFKIILFDSCRVDSSHKPYSLEVNMGDYMEEATQASGYMEGLAGSGLPNEGERTCPYADCVNTLVINATDYRHKAYYLDDDKHPEMKGCGLVTYYFTTLISQLNEPIFAVLAEVRKSVDEFIKQNAVLKSGIDLSPQVLVYDDRLMGNINLLAESKGTERVRPIVNRINPLVLSTTVQWVFRLNVENRIKTFRVSCRGAEGKSIGVDEEPTLRNVARFKNNSLNPKTTYHLKIVAVYNDGFEAESEELAFTTPGRSSPQNISITPTFRGSQNATVKWSFAGEDTDLSGFHVQVNDDGVTEVGASAKEAVIGGLRPSAINPIIITAVYKDGRTKECLYNYQNDELEHATKISSVDLTKFSPESITVDVQWEMSTGEGCLPQNCHFNVLANDKVVVSNCRETHAELQLEPGTGYSLKVQTLYNGDGTHLHSDVYRYTTPTATETKPQINCSEEKRNSVLVTVSDPPVFQNHSVERIHLRDSFRVRRTPIGDEENIGRYKTHTIMYKDAKTDTPGTYRVKLAGNIPGARYRVKVEMDCSSGDTHTNETEFISAKPSCIQKTCCSPYFMLISCLLVALLFSGLSLLYVPYHQYLHANGGTTTHYVLTNDVVQCGEGTSQRYKGINVGGSLKTGDSLQGTFNAWLVPRGDLKLYSEQVGPYSDGYSLTGDHYALLNGWRIYPWQGSVISGYCCVQNQNKTGQNASLHVFSNEEDVSRFQRNGNARNPIISETIDVPTNTERCFRTWGRERPLQVQQSAYHYFVLTVSADNMSFTSEITVLQNYVNTSDYTDRKHFNYNSHTYFPFPRGIRHPTDYVTICQAPDYLSSNFSKPEAESLHILSWGSPYPWQVVFPVITALSCILVFNALIISVALCIAWPYLKSKHRQKIVYCVLYCLNRCSHNRFIRLN